MEGEAPVRMRLSFETLIRLFIFVSGRGQDLDLSANTDCHASCTQAVERRRSHSTTRVRATGIVSAQAAQQAPTCTEMEWHVVFMHGDRRQIAGAARRGAARGTAQRRRATLAHVVPMSSPPPPVRFSVQK